MLNETFLSDHACYPNPDGSCGCPVDGHHIEKIICPKCGQINYAKVEHTPIFDVYIHDCSCGYTITESEWEVCPKQFA